MEIYRLSSKGEDLAHNIRAPQLPAWQVVYFLSKRGAATDEQIKANVPEASGAILRRLKRRGIILGEMGVNV